MRIVLDTNVFVTDFWLRGTDFQVLLSSLESTGHRLYVPQIVVDETKQKFRDQLRKATADAEKAESALSRLVPEYKPRRNSPADHAEERYAKHITAALRAARVDVLPYSRVAHAKFAQRAIAKRRPFDDGGRGYRDALVWDAVMTLAHARGDDVALVTQDVGDFLRKIGEEVSLHADLQQEVSRAFRRVDRVRPYHTLGRFVGSEIQPRLDELASLRATIQKQGRFGKIEVRSALLEKLKTELEGHYIDPLWLGFPEGTLLTISAVTGIPHLEVRDVRRLSDARIVLSVTASVEVRFFQAYPPTLSDSTLVDNYVDTTAPTQEWDDSEEGAFTSNVRLLINKTRSKIVSVQLRSFDPAT